MNRQETESQEPMPVAIEAIAGSDDVFQPGDTPQRARDIPLPWPEARTLLAATRFYWLATVHRDGRPHIRPVLAVWVDGALYSTSNPTAQKARNLERDRRSSITARTDEMDFVVEGRAAKVSDECQLLRVADGYLSKYGWPVTVRNGAFTAPYGAPTSGPPPYDVFQLTPLVVFGFGTNEELAPRSTRWRF